MEFSSERWLLRCEACGATGAIGPRAVSAGDEPAEGGSPPATATPRDAWCEACQRSETVEAAQGARCSRCALPLSTESPRFLEAFGAIQELAAVLAAWRGDVAALRALLPEPPRFITDLTPPLARSGDPAGAEGALSKLGAGAYSAALPEIMAWTAAGPREPRAWEARAIAEERLGKPELAEQSWARAIVVFDSSRARLARGALRARRADYDAAREDLSRAGKGREAGWNRAALRLCEAVAVTPGLPTAEVIRSARREAGPASSYWSDLTVGRLLWSLLVERAESRRRAQASACPDERVLRAAEQEFEHHTFWDRAIVLAGYAALGMRAETVATASPLAAERAEALAAEPFLRARGAETMRDAADAVLAAVRAGDADAAAAEIGPLAARQDLRRYCVPCAACGSGELRAEALEDGATG